ncbi:LPXTG cell wall anchor domain-containing protein, partial [Agromyces tardus]
TTDAAALADTGSDPRLAAALAALLAALGIALRLRRRPEAD